MTRQMGVEAGEILLMYSALCLHKGFPCMQNEVVEDLSKSRQRDCEKFRPRQDVISEYHCRPDFVSALEAFP